MKSLSSKEARLYFQSATISHSTKLHATTSPLPQTTPPTTMSSSTTRPPASSSTTAQQPAEKSFFEQQREVLLKEIGVVSLTFFLDCFE